MKWYTGWYGSWNEPGGVKRLVGTYDRQEIFESARMMANVTGKTVTVCAERGSYRGLTAEFWHVLPGVAEPQPF